MSDLCRVIVDSKPGSGAWNMAVDEVLLRSAIDSQLCSFRIYEWKEPTVSLGYFQRDPHAVDPRVAHLPRVRRLSGGGAILHHLELTYSCAIPADHPLSQSPSRLYDVVHEQIVAELRRCGVDAEIRGTATDDKANAQFLCFLRGDPRDVVVSGCKVVGSAQRRRRGAVLQHGSLVLAQSKYTPELRGVRDFQPDVCGEQLRTRLARQGWVGISEQGVSGELSREELRIAAHLTDNDYADVADYSDRGDRGV